MPGTGFEDKLVEPENIVLPGSCDKNAGWNRTTQIDLGVKFDPGLGSSKVCPREQGQGEVHCRRVEGIDGVFHFQTQVLPGIERTCFAHERFCRVLPKPPVALLVGIRQSGLGNRFSKIQMVSRAGACIEAVGNISHALAPYQLLYSCSVVQGESTSPRVMTVKGWSS